MVSRYVLFRTSVIFNEFVRKEVAGMDISGWLAEDKCVGWSEFLMLNAMLITTAAWHMLHLSYPGVWKVFHVLFWT